MNIIESFNNRELAIASWLAVLILLALKQAGLRTSIVDIVASLLKFKILLPIVTAGIYVTLAVFCLERIGYWQPVMLKATILWFVFEGLVFMASLIGTSGKEDFSFAKTAKHSVAVVVLVAALTSEFSFSIWAELVLVPCAFLLGVAQAIVESDVKSKILKPYLSGIMFVLGFMMLYHAATQFVLQFSILLLKTVLLGSVLTLLFLPLAYLWALIAAYEMLFVRIDVSVENVEERSALKTQLIRDCLLDLNKVRRKPPESVLYLAPK